MCCCLTFFEHHMIIKTIKGSTTCAILELEGCHTDSPEFAYAKKINHFWDKNTTLYFLKSCDLLKIYSQWFRIFRLRIMGLGACLTDWQSVGCWKECGQVEGLPAGDRKLCTRLVAWPLQKELGLEHPRVTARGFLLQSLDSSDVSGPMCGDVLALLKSASILLLKARLLLHSFNLMNLWVVYHWSPNFSAM